MLFCGIFAWNGKSVGSVSKDKLKLLSIYNDLRGGQSIGLYYNNIVHKAITPNNTFRAYWEKNIWEDEIVDNVIIGHSRRASVGYITLRNAQPTIVTVTTADKDSSKIILAHNGTIFNYKELAEEFSVNIKSLDTDTQVLAALLLSEGDIILSRYLGGASLIYTLPNDPKKMYVFRGMSSLNENGKLLQEERPLYFYQEHKNSIYFSSEEGSLIAIAKNKDHVQEVPENTLFVVEDGKMLIEKTINRDAAYQREPIAVAAYNESGLYGSVVNGFYHKKTTIRDQIIVQEIKYAPSLQTLIESKTGIYFYKGRYYIGKLTAHGKIMVDGYGTLYDDDTLEESLTGGMIEYNEIMILYFFKGILMLSKESFDKALIIQNNDSTSAFTRKLCELSPLPVWDPEYVTEAYIYKPSQFYENGGNTAQFFNGSVQPIFSDLKYTFKYGEIQTIEELDEPYYLKDITDVIITNNFDSALYSKLNVISLEKVLIEEEVISEFEDISDITTIEDEPNELSEFEVEALQHFKNEIVAFINNKSADLDMSLNNKASSQFVELLHDTVQRINKFTYTTNT